MRRYNAPPHAFRLPDSAPAAGEPVFNPDETTVRDVQCAVAVRRFGALLPRSQPDQHPFDLRADTVAWRVNGRATGLLRYTQRRGHADRSTSLIVHELQAESSDAYTGLLGLLSEHNNIATIVWNAPVDDPLQQLVVEPRDIEPLVVSDKMVRVVDLARLTVPRVDTSESGSLTLDLRDPHAPWNAGTWEMTADGAVYRFVRITTSRPDLRAEADVLGPVLTGHLPAAAAAVTGRLDGAPGALWMLDRLRAGWAAPYCPDTW